MSRQRKKVQITSMLSTTLKGGVGTNKLKYHRVNDKTSRRLRRSIKRHGNSVSQGQIFRSDARRDSLLAFITSRLETVQKVQMKELHAVNNREEWFRGVYFRGNSIPEPSRWANVGRAFRRAAEAICRGDIGRGAQLMEKAIELEKNTFESMPDYVKDRLDSHATVPEAPPTGRPPEMDVLHATDRCRFMVVPIDIRKMSWEVEKVQTDAPLVGWRGRRLHNWWGPEEEEEEDENADPDKPKKRKKRRKKLTAPEES